MNIIKIILYPRPHASLLGASQDLKLKDNLVWPKHNVEPNPLAPLMRMILVASSLGRAWCVVMPLWGRILLKT
jgi:hypothetical protein